MDMKVSGKMESRMLSDFKTELKESRAVKEFEEFFSDFVIEYYTPEDFGGSYSDYKHETRYEDFVEDVRRQISDISKFKRLFEKATSCRR